MHLPHTLHPKGKLKGSGAAWLVLLSAVCLGKSLNLCVFIPSPVKWGHDNTYLSGSGRLHEFMFVMYRDQSLAHREDSADTWWNPPFLPPPSLGPVLGGLFSEVALMFMEAPWQLSKNGGDGEEEGPMGRFSPDALCRIFVPLYKLSVDLGERIEK